MAYSEELAERVRRALPHIAVEEKKMFGGLCFMVRGHMALGVVSDRLMVRVGPDLYEKALSREHTTEMDFTRKPMKGMIYVNPEGADDVKKVRSFLKLALEFNNSLGEKPPKK